MTRWCDNYGHCIPDPPAADFSTLKMLGYSPRADRPTPIAVFLPGSKVVGPRNSVIYALPDGRFFVPANWSAGGGGFASLSDAQAAAHGGVPADASAQPGYLFTVNPSSWAVAGQPGVTYRPGLGGKAATLTAVAEVGQVIGAGAVIFGAATGILASAAAGSAGSAPAADVGFVMPGAEAVTSGATGGILAEAPALDVGFVMPGAEAASSGATGGILAPQASLLPPPPLVPLATRWAEVLAAARESLTAISAIETAVILATPKKAPAAPTRPPAQTAQPSAFALLLAALGLLFMVV